MKIDATMWMVLRTGKSGGECPDVMTASIDKAGAIKLGKETDEKYPAVSERFPVIGVTQINLIEVDNTREMFTKPVPINAPVLSKDETPK